MQDPAPRMIDDEQAVQHPEAHGRHGKEIQSPRWPRGDFAGRLASAFQDLRDAEHLAGTETRIVPKARSRA